MRDCECKRRGVIDVDHPRPVPNAFVATLWEWVVDAGFDCREGAEGGRLAEDVPSSRAAAARWSLVMLCGVCDVADGCVHSL
jgi:hypothetical protein